MLFYVQAFTYQTMASKSQSKVQLKEHWVGNEMTHIQVPTLKNTTVTEAS